MPSIPTTTEFDLADWGPDGLVGQKAIDDGADGLILCADAQGTKSRPPPFIQDVAGSVQLQCGDGLPSLLMLPLQVSSTYTLETTLSLQALPADFTDPSSYHVYLGVVNAQGGTAGILFSQAGLAVVADPKVPVSPLSGSEGLITSDDLVFRILSDGNAGIATLYVTLASELLTTGHVARKTMVIPKTKLGLGDSLFVEVVGFGGNSGDLLLKSLRFSSSLQIPNKRPVAVIGPDQAVGRGTTVQLDGSGSYDPEDATLTYLWTVVSQPEGSNVQFSDPTAAKPLFFPDVLGLYEFSLVVNDGNLDSVERTSVVNCLETTNEIGRVPDAGFVWNYLPDFYRLIADKEKVQTLWSGLIQAVGADLLHLYEDDYGKSLRDIPRKLTHKWLNFDSKLELAVSVGNSEAQETQETEYEATVVDDADGDFTTTKLTVPDAPDHLQDGDSIVVIQGSVTRLATVARRTGTTIVLEDDVIDVYEVIDEGSFNGEAVDNLIAPDETTTVFGLKYGTLSTQIQAGDLLWTEESGQLLSNPATLPEIASASFITNQLTLVDPVGLEVNQGISWKVLRYVAGTAITVLAPPYIELSTYGEILDDRIFPEDVLRGDVSGEIVAVKEDRAAVFITEVVKESGASVTAYRLTQIPIDEKLTSIPRLQASPGEESSFLSEPKDYTVSGGMLTFTSKQAFETLPTTWWAEYSYSDNSETVENNFGILVGLRQEDFDNVSVDYLASVQALWFALWGGPTVSNILLGTQVFFNLPFAEVDGTILDIEDEYTDDKGRIIIQDKLTPATIRTYFYPKAVGIADSPVTGVQYANGDSVSAFSPLSKGAVVEDYINAPTWYEGILTGPQELRKFHTFRIAIDLSGVGSTKGFGLVKTFADRAKPAYTDIFLTGVMPLEDEISPEADLWLGTEPVSIDDVTWCQNFLTDDLYITPDTGLPFTSGVASTLDHYDGAGNWDGDSVAWPLGGEAPSAIVTYAALTGPLAHGEKIEVVATGSVVGTFKLRVSSTVLLLDIVGGSVPPLTQLRGRRSGRTFTVTAAEVGIWPSFAYINRERSEVWIPLEPSEILGQAGEAGRLQGYANPSATLDPGASNTDDTYTNWMLKVGADWRRITSYDGGTKVAILASDIGAAGDEDYTLHPPKSIARLRDIAFFEPGSWVTGQTSGTEAQVLYFGPAYLRLRNPSVNPYQAFLPGEVILGARGEQAKAVSDVFYVTPDPINTPDRHGGYDPTDAVNLTASGGVIGPEVLQEYKVCFYIDPDGLDRNGNVIPALDMGLKMDDVELYQYPYDSDVALMDQMVPSVGPGLYWWLDKKLVYNFEGANPVWSPVPDVAAASTQVSPDWNDNVLNDVVICRVVAQNGSPGVGSSLPDPVIVQITVP